MEPPSATIQTPPSNAMREPHNEGVRFAFRPRYPGLSGWGSGGGGGGSERRWRWSSNGLLGRTRGSRVHALIVCAIVWQFPKLVYVASDAFYVKSIHESVGAQTLCCDKRFAGSSPTERERES